MDVLRKNQRALQTLERAIELSQGEFSLILVRCNYTRLQERMVESLRQLWTEQGIDRESWLELKLEPSVKTLYSTIISNLDRTQPRTLMIFGLDSVVAIDRLFKSSNQVRDEFRKHCPFPIVLWITEKLLHKLIRLAPDFKSWAAASIKFEATRDELIQLWHDQEKELFARVLDGKANLEGWAIASSNAIHDLLVLPPLCTIQDTHDQLESAWQDLHDRTEIPPDINAIATQHFVMGRYEHALSRIDSALKHYEHSLSFWQATAAIAKPTHRDRQDREKVGVILLYIGLCYWRQAELDRATSYLSHWQAARPRLEQCLQIFEAAERPDLVAKFIPLLGEVWRRLEAWDELAALAQKSLKHHQMSGNPVQLAQDYGFLAEVASQKKQWKKSKSFAQQALTTIACSTVTMRQHQALYLLLLAKSLRHLGQSLEAINYLQLAFRGIAPEKDPRLYIRILKELRSLYYNQGQYQQAFMLKKQQRDIEHQYRFRPFIGASQLPPESLTIYTESGQATSAKRPRIAALGRKKDINNLLSRMARPDQKLIVIYGDSGVGKSSLINAGLVPALDRQPIGDRLALPIVLRTYNDWAGTLAHSLNLNLVPTADRSSTTERTAEWILDTLRQNADRNLLTVVMFDQFEEFFFVLKKASERREFYQFIQACLDIPFTKVVLSLRQDCLHYLLDIDFLARLEIINEDILNKTIRYHLDDFSREDARDVIKNLTKETNFYLEDSLIDTLVQDLANERERVRPIELQLLCNQLQEDEHYNQKITTLAQYRKLGANPKEKLMEHFLHQSIQDCGKENQDAAWKVLYQLTDYQGTRPFRTKEGLAGFLGSQAMKLEVILDILVQSGLVVLNRDAPGDRYQLIHDYLVDHVRQEYDKKFGLKVELRKTKNQLEKSNERLTRFLKLTVLSSVVLTILSIFSAQLWLQADGRKQNLQISAITASSEALFVSGREFDALIEGLRAWKQLKQVDRPTSETRLRVITALEQAIYNVQERNRLNGNRAEVWSVNFSPDGQYIASGGNEEIVKIWNRNGSLYKTLPTETNSKLGHQDNVTFVRFSPDGKKLASASRDKTVKLWDVESGDLIFSLEGHTDSVYGISFNPTGEIMATVSNDGTIKLWQVSDGSLLKNLSGHKESVNGVSFSPTNKWMASASDDKTVKVWTYDGKLVANLRHEDSVTVIGFSADGQTIISGDELGKVHRWDWNQQKRQWNSNPTKQWLAHRGGIYSLSLSNLFYRVNDSVEESEKVTEAESKFMMGEVFNVRYKTEQYLATASHDNLVKVWNLEGELVKEFKGHSGRVTTVSFSPDGELIATGSFDKTVRLWSLVDLFRHPSWEAHGDRITAVSFSPDGELIASGSRDKTIKIWDRDGTLIGTLTGHSDRITSLSFSADGNFLISGSWDKTIHLWRIRDGRLERTFTGHSDRITSVSFSPDGQLIVSASRDRTIKLWSPNGELIKTLTGHGDRVNSVHFSPDGQLIVSGSDDRTLKLWSKKGELLETLAGENGHRSYVTSVRFSPNSQLIASASWDNTVKLWHRNGEFKKTLLQGYSDSVESVSFSPEGKTLASVSWDNTVKLWNIQDGTLIKSLHGHTSGVIDVSFSPDGQSIISGSDDRQLILWNLDLDNLIDLACLWVGDYLHYNPNVSPSDAELCEKEK